MQPQKSLPSAEWPTWLLIVLVYVGWALLIRHFADLVEWFGPWPVVALCSIVLTLHSSLAHELIHGHPTRIQWLNDALACPPLGILFPYWIYKHTHLQHHNTRLLTLPGIDPESYFHHPQAWRNKPPWRKFICRVNMTLAGRLAFGPLISGVHLVSSSITALLRGDLKTRLLWVIHYAACGLLLYVLSAVFSLPVWHYLLAAYLAQSLIQLRSFYEHRPAEPVAHRSVIMHTCLPMRLLFLNNNYHLLHHENPGLPWYRLRQAYLADRCAGLHRNGHFVFNGYRQWLRYLFTPVASPLHPLPQPAQHPPR